MNLQTRQSRRQFIKQALAITGTLGLTTAFGQVEIHERSQIYSEALKKLRAQLKGGLILPTDPGYEAARRVYFWNPDTERQPPWLHGVLMPMMSGTPSNSLVDMDWKSLCGAGATAIWA